MQPIRSSGTGGVVRGERDIKMALAEHHDETQRACLALLGCAYSDDPRLLLEQFHTFERELRGHLALEEELILPYYVAEDPGDAERLREDHEAIRATLDRIGFDVELHEVRARMIAQLVEILRDHAAREEAGMYRWARSHLDPARRATIFDRITRSMRELARARARREHLSY